jgi:hypothetical protein
VFLRGFHSLALRCRCWAFSHFEFAPRYAKLRRFAAKIFQTVENDREKQVLRFISQSFIQTLLA